MKRKRASATNEEEQPALVEWAKERKIEFEGTVDISRGENDGSGLGIFAAKDIAAGEVIMRIPANAIMTVDTALKTDMAAKIKAVAEKRQLTGYCIDEVIFWLFMIAGRDDVSSEWHGYLSALPKTSPEPCGWPEDVRALIEGTILGNSVNDALGALKDVHEKLLPTLVEDEPQMFAKPPTLEDLIWARGMYLSRRFPVNRLFKNGILPSEDKLYTSERQGKAQQELSERLGVTITGSCFMPVLDITNHKEGQKISWVADDKSVAFVAGEPCKAGDEVFNNYASKPNENMLYAQGFCNLRSTHDSVKICVKGKSKDSDEPIYLGTFDIHRAEFGGVPAKLFSVLAKVLDQNVSTSDAVTNDPMESGAKETDQANGDADAENPPEVGFEEIVMLYNALKGKYEKFLRHQEDDDAIIEACQANKLETCGVEGASVERKDGGKIVTSPERMFVAFYFDGQREILQECIVAFTEMIGSVEGGSQETGDS